jgi:hypothetical protein
MAGIISKRRFERFEKFEAFEKFEKFEKFERFEGLNLSNLSFYCDLAGCDMHAELFAEPAARIDLERVLAGEEAALEMRLDVLEVGEVDHRLRLYAGRSCRVGKSNPPCRESRTSV